MKTFLILLWFVIAFAACKSHEKSRAELVTSYYAAFEASDFDQLVPLLADSFTIAEGEYLTTYTHDQFYKQFKWDSVFQPRYELVALNTVDDQVIATVSTRSLRYAFLENNPLTCQFKITFTSGKIAMVELIECIDSDWERWEKKRDALVAWTATHHPELDGFIHDLSMQGAMNYLKAMALYEARAEAH